MTTNVSDLPAEEDAPARGDSLAAGAVSRAVAARRDYAAVLTARKDRLQARIESLQDEFDATMTEIRESLIEANEAEGALLRLEAAGVTQ